MIVIKILFGLVIGVFLLAAVLGLYMPAWWHRFPVIVHKGWQRGKVAGVKGEY